MNNTEENLDYKELYFQLQNINKKLLEEFRIKESVYLKIIKELSR